MTLAAQYITLQTSSPPLIVRALRGSTPPVAVGGFGGWQLITRPRRVALTQWAGVDPFQMQLSLILDGVHDDSSIEADCVALEQMAQPAGLRLPPPIVTVTGVVPHPELAYVIGDGSADGGLAWDANPIYSRSGYRVQQQVTVRLIEFVDADLVASTGAAQQARQAAGLQSAAAAAAAGGTTAPAPTYTVKAGDTLLSIAAAQLGSAARWTEIAQLNTIADPYTLTPGQVIRLP